ncbi:MULTISPECIES: GNAT family protein [unclassified Chelatococcus]|uniref:GNAT family N-acetyltransferase n=1 Tax=unclassified Chelatococcus TaxID=2638111 RepID=UPI001BCAC9E0|nr:MULTISPECIES: GNAT family protein [unclassified Chelatococcus]MBS7696085.1 GNAT family N-acetyltransferase [Chelatococcus sp. YT9]MBX3558068.1 GNAT family N-acetyltransferase [Chelatococcus sp.]
MTSSGLEMLAAVQPAVGAPGREVLPGRYCRLEPLDTARHAAELWQALAGHDRLWDYLMQEPFADEASFTAHVAEREARLDPLCYVVVDAESGKAVGWASLMEIRPQHGVIEVGNVLFSPLLQRTPMASEAIALLASYVFDRLGYRRFEWKCNALNAPSRRAAQRFGFTFEGIFRQHMIVKGKNRDTAWFAMLDSEWPACRAAFDAWLDPANFDAKGGQLRSLTAIRESL